MYRENTTLLVQGKYLVPYKYDQGMQSYLGSITMNSHAARFLRVCLLTSTLVITSFSRSRKSNLFVQDKKQRVVSPCGGPPQWGAADAVIKVPFGENAELKRSPFKTLGRSVCRLACYAYSQGFLPYFFLPSSPFTCIFFPKPLQNFSCGGCSQHWFLCRPAE